jgi:hypothetical protein
MAATAPATTSRTPAVLRASWLTALLGELVASAAESVEEALSSSSVLVVEEAVVVSAAAALVFEAAEATVWVALAAVPWMEALAHWDRVKGRVFVRGRGLYIRGW